MSLRATGIGFLFLAAAGLAGCGEEEVEEAAPVRPVWAVKLKTAEQVATGGVPGRARATGRVDLSFRVSGPLVSLPVVPGDKVEKGQILAQIDPRDFEVALKNAEARLSQAESELAAMRVARPEDIRRAEAALERAKAAVTLAQQDMARVNRIKEQDPGAVAGALIDEKAAAVRSTESELRNAEQELRIARIGARSEDIAAKEGEIRALKAAVADAKNKLSYTELRAPFAGTIVAKYVENFQTVLDKQNIVRLLDTSRIEFVVNLPEHDIGLLPFVRDIEVVFDTFPDTKIPAEIKEVGTEASETTRTYPVVLIMDQPEGVEILAGMAGKATGKADLPSEQIATDVVVPVTAVFSDKLGETSYVWVVDEASNKVAKREVSVRALVDGGTAIEKGLETGEWVVIAGVNFLEEGDEVKIIDPATEPGP